MNKNNNDENPLEKDWKLKQDICNYLKNPVNIALEKRLVKLKLNDMTLRLKRLFNKKGTPEEWKRMKVIWKGVIDFYREKDMF